MKSTFLEFNQGETSNHSKKKKNKKKKSQTDMPWNESKFKNVTKSW